MNYPSTAEFLIFLWFAVSVFIAVVGTFVFWFGLRRRGVRLVFGLTGIPGYMEIAYIEWCRTRGRRPNISMLVFRGASIINVIVAAIFAIPLLSAK